jgi:hypothetical protein
VLTWLSCLACSRAELAKAAAKLAGYITEFRQQADRAAVLLPLVPAAAFADLVQRTSAQLAAAAAAEHAAFVSGFAESQKVAGTHLAQLKPSLVHREAKAAKNLFDSEDARYAGSKASIARLRSSLLQTELTHAQRLLNRLISVTASLVALNDSCLAPADLPPPQGMSALHIPFASLTES